MNILLIFIFLRFLRFYVKCLLVKEWKKKTKIVNTNFFTEEDEERELQIKKRKESMRKFPTLYKIDPTVVDDCTEEIPIERTEEKRIRLVNEKKKKNEKKEEMSTHTRDAIKAVGIARYSKFITVHVENFFGCARWISFFSLFREVEMAA